MSTCYFHILTPELVQDIFLLCVVKRSGHFIEFKRDAPPLVFLHVCKRWRALAYATSGLFDSITLRRRTHAPIGFDFFRDSYILLDFLNFTRNAAPWLGSKELVMKGTDLLPPRPLSIELRYGDIRQFGNTLMWSDLVSMTRAILDTTSNLERFHLRFPDDCMERLLNKICLHSGKKVVNHALKSLSLHSTRESVLVKRYEDWWDEDSGHDPSRIHILDTSGLSGLMELGLHFPGPLRLEPKCMSVRTLSMSVFKWFQFEEYLKACPSVEHLTLELRASLKDKLWEAMGELSELHTLEIRSHLSGAVCAMHIMTLLSELRLPKLRRLVFRRHHRASKTGPAAFCFINAFKPNFQHLEEIEFIDVTVDPYGLTVIEEFFNSMPKLRRFAYREVEMSSSADHVMYLLSRLCIYGHPLRAPCLEVLEINTSHYREENPQQNLIDGLLHVINSRREQVPPANTDEAKEQIERRFLREVYMPHICLDAIRRRNAQSARSLLGGVRLGPLPEIEPLENEDDLDDEGEPRDPEYEPERPNWKDGPTLDAAREDAFSSETPMGDENIPDADDSDTYHKHTDLDMDYSLDYEEDEDMDSMGGDTLVGSSGPSSYHSVSALRRYDSVAEVELML